MTMKVRYSARTAWDLSENELSRAIAKARAAGRTLYDLTESNPTRAGLGGGAELIARLGHPRGADYSPEALGHPEARAAAAAYHRARGVSVDASSICMTASTSEAYSYLLKLLFERDERLLVPAPSYPLLAYLAALEDVELAPYPLVREQGFRIDFGALSETMDDRSRAIVVVNPNNPTGTFVRREDADALDELASERGMAVISDEVFADYVFGSLEPDRQPTFAGPRRALTFVLTGLSKLCLMPQVKLGWIAVFGPPEEVREAMQRLEVIADTYLSVGTPVQRALPEILAAREALQAPVKARTHKNLMALDRALARRGAAVGVRRLPLDGGWYAILEVPRTRDEDAWAIELVEKCGVVVHPGYFFDLDRAGYLVVSLLPEPRAFTEAVKRLVTALARG